MAGPGLGALITWVPRKWLTRAIRERGASTRQSPTQAASGPEASGQIRPSPWALAVTAAGNTPATGTICPSRPSSPTAAHSARLSGGITPMDAITASAMGRS